MVTAASGSIRYSENRCPSLHHRSISPAFVLTLSCKTLLNRQQFSCEAVYF